MARSEDFEKRGNCKQGHCSLIGKAAWTDLKRGCTVPKMHDMCGRSGYKCQKLFSNSPKQ